MNIHEATAQYEAWAAQHLALVPDDLDLKHTRMAEGRFAFLRARGWEPANVHLGTRGAAKKISRDLAARPAEWLREGAGKMVECVSEDFREWKNRPQAPGSASSAK